MADRIDILGEKWCELIFENRNQAYGAYELRRMYAKNAFVAAIISLFIFVFSIGAPVIIRMISSKLDENSKVKIVEENTLLEPPPIDKTEPPPPPVEPPPPLKETIKFTPPVIVKDEEVQEEPPPTQETLKEVDAGVKTQAGDTGGVDLSLLEGNKVIDEPAKQEIFTIVEQMPVFPGGEGELMKYLQKNIKNPAMAKENGITGTVYCQFVIDVEGKVTDVKVVRGVPGLDGEATRVIKSMPPWKPGKQTGKAVPVQFTLPIKFTLN